VVEAAITLLKRLGHDQAAPYFAQGLAHRDPAIRESFVRALGALSGASATRALGRALVDAHESVRLQAAHQLGQRLTPDAAGVLLEIIRRPDFPTRRPPELEALLEALSHTAPGQAFDTLQDFLCARQWWHPRYPAPLRAAAARVLGRLGTPAARELLASLTDRDHEVLAACREALRGGARSRRGEADHGQR
jgi:HEAT repeat protein